MVGQNKPAAEVEVTPALVHELLLDQFPGLSSLTLQEEGSGWDNAVFRLGSDLAVRLPRRAIAAPGALIEQTWLPMIADHVPFGVPTPVHIGEPSHLYPWSWTVVEWFDGQVLGSVPVAAGGKLPMDLGAFMSALHRTAPEGLAPSSIRGCPLAWRDERFRWAVDQLGSSVDEGAVVAAWHSALSIPDWPRRPVVVHGDVHPLNIVVDHERNLVAVIDFGDLNAGDPATDLAIAWTTFGATDRVIFKASCSSDGLPIDDDTWARARGWALNFAILYLSNSADLPALHEIGERALAEVLSDSPI